MVGGVVAIGDVVGDGLTSGEVALPIDDSRVEPGVVDTELVVAGRRSRVPRANSEVVGAGEGGGVLDDADLAVADPVVVRCGEERSGGVVEIELEIATIDEGPEQDGHALAVLERHGVPSLAAGVLDTEALIEEGNREGAGGVDGTGHRAGVVLGVEQRAVTGADLGEVGATVAVGVDQSGGRPVPVLLTVEEAVAVGVAIEIGTGDGEVVVALGVVGGADADEVGIGGLDGERGHAGLAVDQSVAVVRRTDLDPRRVEDPEINDEAADLDVGSDGDVDRGPGLRCEAEPLVSSVAVPGRQRGRRVRPVGDVARRVL